MVGCELQRHWSSDWQVTMPLGLDGLTSLSKTSDHLGNLANALKDLGGGATLLHELDPERRRRRS